MLRATQLSSKLLLYAAKVLLVLLVALASYQYFQIKLYEFPEARPFVGDQFYNPYQHTRSEWLKGNFHTHAKAWGGITNGAQSGKEVLAAYQGLGYDIPCISDYFSINAEQPLHDASFVPVYEHGINLFKSHRLAIGSTAVSYYDVSLLQNQSIRQYLIERIKQQSPIVAIAHPTMRNSHPLPEFGYLTGYDCLEVLNSGRIATAHWDRALSSGKPVWILANDDCHDTWKNHTIARCWTMVNTGSRHRDSVLQALQQGQTYGVKRMKDASSRQELLATARNYENALQSLQVRNDTLTLELNHQANHIKLIGQEGKVLLWVFNQEKVAYALTKQDTYVRAEVYDDAYAYYFNPVVRYNGGVAPTNTMQAQMDVVPTLTLRLLIIYANIVFIFLLYRKAVLRLLRIPQKAVVRRWRHQNA